ncbi:putative ABC transporter permease [Lachnospiraceae bacterium LCP25S3_G4]
MKKLSECLFLWGLGGCLYYGFEVAFRGFSHWSMFALGGLCFLFCWLQGFWTKWQDPLWMQVLRTTLFVISSEFIIGILVNKVMKWYVWDYSDQPLQLWGQICAPFAIIFSGLVAIGIILSGNLIYWLYNEAKPHFYVL